MYRRPTSRTERARRKRRSIGQNMGGGTALPTELEGPRHGKDVCLQQGIPIMSGGKHAPQSRRPRRKFERYLLSFCSAYEV